MVFAALSFAVAGTWARAALTVGLVISALAMLVGLLSLGALLAPTVAAAAIALVVARPGAHTRAATEEPQQSQERGLPVSRSARELRAQPRGLRGLGLKAVGIRCPRMSEESHR